MTEEAEQQADVWTIRRVIAWATDDLKKRGSTSPRLDVELLLGKVLDLSRVDLIVQADKPLAKDELTAYRAFHARRRGGEPIAYLVGVREFFGRPFRVDKRVLIPRPDTETLVEVALERMRHLSLAARMLDLCTGSGCVAISLQRERPTWQVTASDVSKDALDVARDNALRLGAVTMTLVRSDLFAAIDPTARFDLITANPPYIAAAEVPELAIDIRGFEPKLALTPGADGLAIARKIIDEAPKHLAAGGALAMEIGAGQAPETMELFRARGFDDVRAKKDYGGHERVVSGVLRG